jgi:NAD-dependent deacetylase
VTVLTQNVDGLHQRAGTDAVLELHGNASRTRCADEACTSEPFEDDRAPTRCS